MEWVPVSREKFETILAEEIAALRPEGKRLYEQCAIPLFQQSCLRGESYANEQVYVVAKNGDRLIYCDDVEEEFRVSIPDADGVLRKWGNYGPLATALLVLDE